MKNLLLLAILVVGFFVLFQAIPSLVFVLVRFVFTAALALITAALALIIGGAVWVIIQIQKRKG